MRIIATGRRIDHTLQYRDVNFFREEVGRIPNDIFLPTDQTPPLDSLKHSRPVMVQQPEFEGQKVKVNDVTRRFQASAPSPLLAGALGAFVGGVSGAIVGGFCALATGQGAFLVGAGALGLAGGAFLGATDASSKEVQLSVQKEPILSKTMTGIDTRVRQGSLKGKSGYFHSFSAQLETTHHGTYDVPSVRTVRQS